MSESPNSRWDKTGAVMPPTQDKGNREGHLITASAMAGSRIQTDQPPSGWSPGHNPPSRSVCMRRIMSRSSLIFVRVRVLPTREDLRIERTLSLIAHRELLGTTTGDPRGECFSSVNLIRVSLWHDRHHNIASPHYSSARDHHHSQGGWRWGARFSRFSSAALTMTLEKVYEQCVRFQLDDSYSRVS